MPEVNEHPDRWFELHYTDPTEEEIQVVKFELPENLPCITSIAAVYYQKHLPSGSATVACFHVDEDAEITYEDILETTAPEITEEDSQEWAYPADWDDDDENYDEDDF